MPKSYTASQILAYQKSHQGKLPWDSHYHGVGNIHPNECRNKHHDWDRLPVNIKESMLRDAALKAGIFSNQAFEEVWLRYLYHGEAEMINFYRAYPEEHLFTIKGHRCCELCKATKPEGRRHKVPDVAQIIIPLL